MRESQILTSKINLQGSTGIQSPQNLNNYCETTMGYEGKVKGRRKKPYPNSILDRKALTEALEEAGISVKRIHMDEFYKTLHKQRYPPLAQFVENYYANDGKDYTRPNQHKSQSQQEGGDKQYETGQLDSQQSPLVKSNQKKNQKNN